MPRAASSADLATDFATLFADSVEFIGSASTIERNVNSIFVPVSPSGTGNTFRALIVSRLASTDFVVARIMLMSRDDVLLGIFVSERGINSIPLMCRSNSSSNVLLRLVFSLSHISVVPALLAW